MASLAHVEVTSAIVRRGREPGTTREQVANALATLDREMQEIFVIVELGGPLISLAIELAKTRALRSADAIQLACALISRRELPATTELYLVSADEELNAAATAEGLRVENPNSHQ